MCSSLDEKLTNLGTGQALDSSNAANGAAVKVGAPGGQNQDWYLQGNSGNADFLNNVATFGIWRSKELLNLAIAEDPSSKDVHYVATNGASIPSYGQWYYIDRGAGSPLGAVMLVNTQTTGCLAAPGGAGSPVVVVPCDATDKTQWWVAS